MNGLRKRKKLKTFTTIARQYAERFGNPRRRSSGKRTQNAAWPLCERSDYKLVHLNSRSHNGEIVQLQSALNDDYNNFQEKIKHVPHFRAHNWKIFPKPCTFTSEQFHWFIQLRKETLQHCARFWRPFRSVMWSRSILVPFLNLGVSLSFFSSLIL